MLTKSSAYRCTAVTLAVIATTTCVVAEDTPSFGSEQRFLDRDGNGRIDESELTAGQQMAALLLSLTWEQCDRNQDGQVTSAEFKAVAGEAYAAAAADQTQLEPAAEEEAVAALAQATSLRLILDRLAADHRYAAEVAALRAAVERADDDDAVVTYLLANPERYPHLLPAVRAWVRYYPVRPELYRKVWHTPRATHAPVAHAKPTIPPTKSPKPAVPAAGKPAPKPVTKPSPAPHHASGGGGRAAGGHRR